MATPPQLILIIDAREYALGVAFIQGKTDDPAARIFSSEAEAMEYFRGSLFDGKCPFVLMDIDDFEWDF